MACSCHVANYNTTKLLQRLVPKINSQMTNKQLTVVQQVEKRRFQSSFEHAAVGSSINSRTACRMHHMILLFSTNKLIIGVIYHVWNDLRKFFEALTGNERHR